MFITSREHCPVMSRHCRTIVAEARALVGLQGLSGGRGSSLSEQQFVVYAGDLHQSSNIF